MKTVKVARDDKRVEALVADPDSYFQNLMAEAFQEAVLDTDRRIAKQRRRKLARILKHDYKPSSQPST